MKHRFAMGVLFFIVLLSVPAAAAQPLPPPLSPDETRLLAEYPELRDARAQGGMVFTGVAQFGCDVSALVLNMVMFAPKPDQVYEMRTVASVSGLVYMNEAVERTFLSGPTPLPVSDAASGGIVNSAFPMPADSPVLVRVMLSQKNGKPLWYAEVTVNDCEGTPDTISGSKAAPVQILTKNPTFAPKPANPARAQAWKTSGKVKYACVGGVCTEKLKGKAGQIAMLTQKVNFPTPVPSGMRLGLIIIADATGATGLASLAATYSFEALSPNTINYFFMVDTPGWTGSKVVFMPTAAATLTAIDKVELAVELKDSLGSVASGKIKIRAIYFYGVKL